MRVTLPQLEAVLWSVRLGSMRAAAGHLRVTQPAITARLRELEQELGGAVFDRSQLRPALTAIGREVVAYAERFEALRAEMVRDLAPERTFVGPVRFGVTDSFALTCLPALMARMEAAHPEARIHLEVNFSTILAQRLDAGELDIAVLTTPRSSPRIAIHPLVDLSVNWVASPRLALRKGTLRPADLVDFPILSNPHPSNLYDSITSWFAPLGRQPERLHTCNSLTVMSRLAVAATGVTLLPVAILGAELGSGQLRVLRTAPGVPPHPLGVAYRKDYPGAGLQIIAEAVAELAAASELAAGARGATLHGPTMPGSGHGD